MDHRCQTPGCFEEASQGLLCPQCRRGDPPERRGMVSARDLYFAKVFGGRDAEVTRFRLDHPDETRAS